MNPMTNVKNVLKLSERELSGKSKTSWHDQYKDSAWVFVGGLPYDLTEGDIICVFSQFYRKYTLPGVLACVDGTHVAIVTPNVHEERFKNRKGYHSMNVMIMCDSNLNILCVDASYPGSTHDSVVWANHYLNAYLDRLHRVEGEDVYLLGDSGYPLRATMMIPITNPSPGTPEEYYQNLHLSARSVVERCIGVLKARFRYGEIVNINLVRDKATGKSRGFSFICYEDQRSTILAVDNLNGTKILGRTVRVDHCEQYRAPNADMSKVDEVTAAIRMEGCAPQVQEPSTKTETVVKPDKEKDSKESKESTKASKVKKKKEKKSKKKKKKKSKSSSSESESSN